MSYFRLTPLPDNAFRLIRTPSRALAFDLAGTAAVFCVGNGLDRLAEHCGLDFGKAGMALTAAACLLVSSGAVAMTYALARKSVDNAIGYLTRSNLQDFWQYDLSNDRLQHRIAALHRISAAAMTEIGGLAVLTALQNSFSGAGNMLEILVAGGLIGGALHALTVTPPYGRLQAEGAMRLRGAMPPFPCAVNKGVEITFG